MTLECLSYTYLNDYILYEPGNICHSDLFQLKPLMQRKDKRNIIYKIN